MQRVRAITACDDDTQRTAQRHDSFTEITDEEADARCAQRRNDHVVTTTAMVRL